MHEVGGPVFLDYWPVLLSALAYIIWLVRLEGKVKANSTRQRSIEKQQEKIDKEIENLKDKDKYLELKFTNMFLQIKSSLARIEGKLGIRGE